MPKDITEQKIEELLELEVIEILLKDIQVCNQRANYAIEVNKRILNKINNLSSFKRFVFKMFFESIYDLVAEN